MNQIIYQAAIWKSSSRLNVNGQEPHKDTFPTILSYCCYNREGCYVLGIRELNINKKARMMSKQPTIKENGEKGCVTSSTLRPSVNTLKCLSDNGETGWNIAVYIMSSILISFP